ncbi:hypothetical protein AB6D11_06000 [Vibrio splendidus]
MNNVSNALLAASLLSIAQAASAGIDLSVDSDVGEVDQNVVEHVESYFDNNQYDGFIQGNAQLLTDSLSEDGVIFWFHTQDVKSFYSMDGEFGVELSSASSCCHVNCHSNCHGSRSWR